MHAKAIALLALAACARVEDSPAETEAEAAVEASTPNPAPEALAGSVGQPVQLEIRDLVVQAQGAEIRVTYLSGELRPVGDLVDLDAPASFSVHIEALEVVIPEQAILAGLSDGEKPPFRELIIRTEGESIALEGASGPGGLPFTFRADPAVTDDGELVLELEKVHVLGIGVRGFLGALQGAIEKRANRDGHLIDVDEERLVVDPFPFAGPPRVHAEFTSFEVREHELVARLGEPLDAGGSARLVLSGGVFRTGHVVMYGTTMRMVPEGGGDLRLDPEQLDAQIEGGFAKQQADGSLTFHLAAPRDQGIVIPAPSM